MIDYKIIDLNTYPRRAHLEHFMSMTNPQMSITSMVDVTELKAFCKRENCSFFLAFLHIVNLSAENIPQMRQRIHKLTADELQLSEHATAPKNGPAAGIEIREYSECPTSHTEPAGDEIYCYCTLHHNKPWNEYITSSEILRQNARNNSSLKEDDDFYSYFFITCLPWIHFCDLSNPITDRFDSNPRFSWGKFEEDYRGRLMMPLSVEVHHGLVDGIHIGKFYSNVEQNITALIEGKI